MLHAIASRKTRYHRRYHGERDGSEAKVSEEDEITSTVLGPLEFMGVEDGFQFWQSVIKNSGTAFSLPETPPSQIRYEFWPRRQASDNSGRIEPDLLVTLRWPDGLSRWLLVELKWRAPLSGQDQLHRQWLNFLNAEERANALHIFIAPTIAAGAEAISHSNVWGERGLSIISWLQIRSTLRELSREKSGIGYWSAISDHFLEAVGIRRYHGIKNVKYNGIDIPMELPSSVFWKQSA